MSLVKNIFLFFCIYKMYPISAEGYKNARVDLLIVITIIIIIIKKKTGENWTKMEDVQDG